MLSKYNIYINRDNTIWIYNNFKKKIIGISKDEYDQLCHNKLMDSDLTLYKRLAQFGIVYVGEDEAKTLLDTHRNSLECSGLEVMIMSSTACNFACTYCYEEFKPKNIDSKFENIFIEFLYKNIGKYQSLFIEWFGGEPLLAKKCVISIAKKTKIICQENNKPFLSSITTNGYYLDFETFSELLEGNVIYFQITIDGNREWHDKYRPLKTGGKTYDVVFNNLLSIKQKVADNKIFRITIRNNVSIENRDACIQFKQIFEENFGDDDRFQLFYFPIKDWGGNRIVEIRGQLLATEEILTMSNTKNYRNDIFESVISSCCIAAKKNGFVIDPDYDVYKCNHYIQGTEAKGKYNKVGALKASGSLVIDEDINSKWVHPIISEQCRLCIYLPNCLTTCPLYKIEPKEGCWARKKIELENKINKYIERKL